MGNARQQAIQTRRSSIAAAEKLFCESSVDAVGLHLAAAIEQLKVMAVDSMKHQIGRYRSPDHLSDVVCGCPVSSRTNPSPLPKYLSNLN